MILYVSNISLELSNNIELMYKNTLCNTSWGPTVREIATPTSTPNKKFQDETLLMTRFGAQPGPLLSCFANVHCHKQNEVYCAVAD